MRMQRRARKLRLILLGGVLLATAASASFRAGQVCTSDTFAVRDGFVAARRGTCTVLAANQVRVDIRPERSKDRKKDILFLLGRQHPPEVSGAFAFFAFTETVLGDTELAREFRQRFRVIAIPVLNPDGITGGNWRMNLGGVDLNRDWGKFDEPAKKPDMVSP